MKRTTAEEWRYVLCYCLCLLLLGCASVATDYRSQVIQLVELALFVCVVLPVGLRHRPYVQGYFTRGGWPYRVLKLSSYVGAAVIIGLHLTFATYPPYGLLAPSAVAIAVFASVVIDLPGVNLN